MWNVNIITVKDNKGNYFVVDKNDSRYLNGELHGTFFNRKHKKETIEKVKQTFKNIKHQQGAKILNMEHVGFINMMKTINQLI